MWNDDNDDLNMNITHEISQCTRDKSHRGHVTELPQVRVPDLPRVKPSFPRCLLPVDSLKLRFRRTPIHNDVVSNVLDYRLRKLLP